ncbi:MAG: HEPN domain-containing protein [Candidatus Binatia bacterium]
MCLEAARRELEAKVYAFVIKRTYDALFYAVSALLLEGWRRCGKTVGSDQCLIKTSSNLDA